VAIISIDKSASVTCVVRYLHRSNTNELEVEFTIRSDNYQTFLQIVPIQLATFTKSNIFALLITQNER